MLYRFLFCAVLAPAVWLGASSGAHAACSEGYLERFDQRGDSFCVSIAEERKRQLAVEQMMRRVNLDAKRQVWRDRQRLAQARLR